MRRPAIAALLVTVAMLGCRGEAKREPRSEKFPAWIPLRGLPLPGHGKTPAVNDSPIRQLTAAEMVAIAYKFHPVFDPDEVLIEDFDRVFWNSPEHLALARVQREGYARLAEWQTLCAAVRRSLPPVYTVADRTYPRYDPTYVIVIDAPIEPGSIEERFLVVHVSYLVPYYFYYELHSRRIDGLIDRDPLLHEVTPVFTDALAAIEREIAARYGYWRMSPEVAGIYVPGVQINGYHDWEEHPPTLQDALFTPHRW